MMNRVVRSVAERIVTYKRMAGIAVLSVVVGLSWMPALSVAASFFTIDDAGNVGIGNSSPTARLDVTGAIYSRLVTASSTTVNWNNGNVQSKTLSSNETLTFSNGQTGGQYVLIVTQDATGGRTISWPASVKWSSGGAPTLSVPGDSVDTFYFVYDGASYLGSYKLNHRAPTSVAYDASGGTVVVSSTSTISWSHTTTGTNRALVVWVYQDGSTTDNNPSVTYNGASMTRQDSASVGNFRIYSFYLKAPATGTHDVVVTNGVSTSQLGGISQSYTGVEQSDSPDSHSSGTQSGTTSFSLSTTVNSSNSWVVGASRNNGEAPSAGTGTTIRNTQNTMAGADSNAALGTGSRSLVWTTSSSLNFCGVIMSLSPIQ